MEGTDDEVLLQTDFGLVDGRKHYLAMVAPEPLVAFKLRFRGEMIFLASSRWPVYHWPLTGGHWLLPTGC